MATDFKLENELVQRLYIHTEVSYYQIIGREVYCEIVTHLVARFQSGKKRYIHRYIGKGLAQCSPEDKFDANIGIKLATVRAENDYYKHYQKILEAYNKSLITLHIATTSLINECEGQTLHNNEYITPLIMREEVK